MLHAVSCLQEIDLAWLVGVAKAYTPKSRFGLLPPCGSTTKRSSTRWRHRSGGEAPGVLRFSGFMELGCRESGLSALQSLLRKRVQPCDLKVCCKGPCYLSRSQQRLLQAGSNRTKRVKLGVTSGFQCF